MTERKPMEPVWVATVDLEMLKTARDTYIFAKRPGGDVSPLCTPLFTADQVREAVERVRLDVTRRCPPGFSAFTGGERYAGVFERGYDVALDALLAELGLRRTEGECG
jgi:hypothetical protein